MDADGHIGLGGRDPSSSFKLTAASGEIQSINCSKIGINKSPDATYLLDLGSKGRIYNPYGNHIIFDPQGGYYSPAILPTSNNTCNLGTAGKAFAHVYTYNLHDLNSDLRHKENVKDLKHALDIIMGLRGITYDLKKEIAYNDSIITDPEEIAKLEEKRKDRIGFVGQEVIEVLPAAVEIDDSSGIYTIDYTRVIPVLVNAMHEQQEKIEELEEKIKEKSAVEAIPDIQKSKTALLQNRPNPFSENTLIEYSLAEDVASATLYIYDMNGTQLRSIPLHQRGEGSVEINGGELKAGMYMYTMITDGQVIDTKTMVLTD